MVKQVPGSQKLYYTIGEVASMFDVNPSLIRYWEKEFDIIRPAKNKKGNRLFTSQDIDHFHIIYHLVKERGFTLQGAKDKLRSNKQETLETDEIVRSLKKLKQFLIEIKDNL